MGSLTIRGQQMKNLKVKLPSKRENLSNLLKTDHYDLNSSRVISKPLSLFHVALTSHTHCSL